MSIRHFYGNCVLSRLIHPIAPLLSALLAATTVASADPSLNATGIADGFHITTFASGFPMVSPTFGVKGVTSTSDGNILVADPTGTIYEFSDIDGQTVSNAINTTPIPAQTSTNAGGTPYLAQSGGVVYMVSERQLFSLNNNGSSNKLFLNGALVTGGGLAVNAVTGHLYSNANIAPSENFADINPLSNSYSLRPGPGGNLMTTSLDGSTVYAAAYPYVKAYNTTTWALNWSSTSGSGYASTAATIQNGPFAGDLIGYNEVLGELLLFDSSSGQSTVIGTGGTTSLGGVMGYDYSNGSILFGVGSDVLRITTVATSPVLLNIAPQANNVVLFWNTNAVGFSLESSTDLSSGPWIAVPGTPIIIGGQFYVTNAITAGNAFFRLAHP